MSGSDSEKPDWLCLTPLSDASGRPLTLEQRLTHAAGVIREHNERAFGNVQAQVARMRHLTPAQQQAVLRSVTDHLNANAESLLNDVAKQLAADHRWMVKNWVV
jgi:hypothetical protein